MIQVIEGKKVYVVDFETMPELPITGYTEEEMEYYKFVGRMFGNLNGLLISLASGQGSYAKALTNAIETGVITEPGKYGIYLVPESDKYEIYKIVE